MARSGNRVSQTPVVRRGGYRLPIFRKRARLYVDGFNLHLAILDLERRELLWLDLNALGKTLLPPGERLAGVTWVSAHRPQRRDRMEALLAGKDDNSLSPTWGTMEESTFGKMRNRAN